MADDHSMSSRRYLQLFHLVHLILPNQMSVREADLVVIPRKGGLKTRNQ